MKDIKAKFLQTKTDWAKFHKGFIEILGKMTPSRRTIAIMQIHVFESIAEAFVTHPDSPLSQLYSATNQDAKAQGQSKKSRTVFKRLLASAPLTFKNLLQTSAKSRSPVFEMAIALAAIVPSFSTWACDKTWGSEEKEFSPQFLQVSRFENKHGVFGGCDKLQITSIDEFFEDWLALNGEKEFSDSFCPILQNSLSEQQDLDMIQLSPTRGGCQHFVWESPAVEVKSIGTKTIHLVAETTDKKRLLLPLTWARDREQKKFAWFPQYRSLVIMD
jgi:hypothetical protein